MITPTWRNGRLYAIADEHIDNVYAALQEMCEGQYHKALAQCLHMGKMAGYHSSCIGHAIQMLADKTGPNEFGGVFTSDEWNDFIDEMGEAGGSYYSIRDILAKWSERANAKLGVF